MDCTLWCCFNGVWSRLPCNISRCAQENNQQTTDLHQVDLKPNVNIHNIHMNHRHTHTHKRRQRQKFMAWHRKHFHLGSWPNSLCLSEKPAPNRCLEDILPRFLEETSPSGRSASENGQRLWFLWGDMGTFHDISKWELLCSCMFFLYINIESTNGYPYNYIQLQ